ncbi:hypothetical protein J2Z23_001937 [Lederbergia galactosidilyticus]|uniref:CehA/McbA family metallohydrolase n=1 Tax=Lederbergia galactosidilytica TaxID=217031 RepID=UPI001D68D21C|nr:hypothetical protein [Lederbergia galactosidilytica]
MRKVIQAVQKYLCIFAIICLVLQLAPTIAAGQNESKTKGTQPPSKIDRAEYLGMSLYKGHLHTHTSLSDGIKLPSDAYEYVKNNTNLDFYAVTEHDVTYDISTGSDYIDDYLDSYSDEYKLLHEQSNDHNQNNQFITLPGTEVTWYDDAGHINLFNADWFPRTYGKGADGTWGWGNRKYDLPTFYARLAQDPDAIGQFNHPSASGKGNFFDFKHYNPDVDENMNLFEYKYSSHFDTFMMALDKGWHIAPTFGGDEHKGSWGTVQPNVTGLWTKQFSRNGIYDAMKNRRTFSSFDRNLELAFSANNQIMGSILPVETKKINIHIEMKDPDPTDEIDKVVVYKNKGEVVKEYKNIAATEFSQKDTFPSEDGDYFLVRVFQKDGDEAITAPIWIGEHTRGTDSAPEIKISGNIPDKVKMGDTVLVPEASAMDDRGESPDVKVDVFDAKRTVDVTQNRFKISEYGEYFIRYTATDSRGNTRVELKRIVVDNKNLDAEKLLNEFEPTVHVGEDRDEIRLNLVTDNVLEKSYVQFQPKTEQTSKKWNKAKNVKTEVSHFQVAYGDTFEESNYRVMSAHEATLSGLQKGTVYKYRYGSGPNGPWSNEYEFKTADSNEATMYIMGDLDIQNQGAEEYQTFNQMLEVLKEKNADGQLLIQTGNFIGNGGHISAWNNLFKHIYKDINIPIAHVVGEQERFTDRKLGAFSGFHNFPKNGEGSYQETNYSFDDGEVHVAVLHSLLHLDEQLEWLEKDMRATDKKWKVVMGHYPYFGGQFSDEPGMDINRTKVAKKFQQLGISLYLGGQDRIYKRTTIRDGEKDTSEQAMNLGTTFVTVGSAGTHFYGNKEFNWDHIVYDEKLQTGIILEADQDSLRLKAYNVKGEEIDQFTIKQPQDYLDLTSFEVDDTKFKGIGLLNYPGPIDKVVVVGEKYDYAGEKLLETQVKEMKLEHLGREQVILFDKPIPFEDQHMLKVTIYDENKKPLIPTRIVKEGMIGDGSEENPYKIKSVAGLNKLHEFPDKHFILEEDILGEGNLFPAVGVDGPSFTGVFDGNGHTISGLIVSTGGAGLFAVNAGVIKNVGLINTDIDVQRSNVGMLVDQNDGMVESSYSTGSIIGNSTVGGLVGYSNGTVKNSYSTARVKARGKQAGGVICITNRESLTENIYASGSVSAGQSNAGGLSGYAYNATTIQNSIALNPSVVTISSANRIVGRVLAGETATLNNNLADENMIVSKEGITKEDPQNEKGLGKAQEELNSQTLFEEELGWDFHKIWIWNEEAGRPLLAQNQEKLDIGGGKQPPLEKNEQGFYWIQSFEDLEVINQFPSENYILQKDLGLAGKTVQPVATDIPFMGIFDGNGKVIRDYRSISGGLFHMNRGTIKNIGILEADVTGDNSSPQTGILVDLNNGKIEQSFSTGKVSGANTVGGLVGYSNKIIRNSYSTADIIANVSQAGGVIGITNTGSTTENVYATGNVKALKSNAGGISGYGYNGTVLKNSIALNATVTTPTSANRVMGRVLAGHTATLENNYAFDEMNVDVEGVKEESPTTIKGRGLSQDEIEVKTTYEERLGWNFETIWEWDELRKRPILKDVKEE